MSHPAPTGGWPAMPLMQAEIPPRNLAGRILATLGEARFAAACRIP